MKRILLGASIATLALATPVMAQDAEMEAGDAEISVEVLGAMLGEDEDFQAFLELFKPKPLTPEQEARLPLAAQVVGAMIPDGTMGELMTSMFRDIVGPYAALEAENQAEIAASMLGWYVGDEDIDEVAATKIIAILDPSREAREAATMDAIETGIADVMAVMEPAIRDAMSKAYAASFSDAELTDIGAFFTTPSGAAFASKSYKLASDPTIFVGMLENLPQMMGPIMAAVSTGEEAIEALPQQKGYADLTASERARLAELSGLNISELEEAMSLDDEEDAIEESGEEWDN